MPIVDDDGVLAGVLTERSLARRYIRESREPSELDAPTNVSAIARVLGGRLVCGDESAEVSGQIWCLAMDVGSLPSEIGAGDVVVVGNRDDAQRAAIELGVGLLVTSNGTAPTRRAAGARRRARRRGRVLAAGQLRDRADDHAVGAVPGTDRSAAADRAPGRPALRHRRRGQGGPLPRRRRGRLAPAPDRADHAHRTSSTRRPRRVLLVDHAEQAQSVPGVEQAEIVEILDHHHIGSIETTIPVRATFDPVGSTATLVIERFRQNGMEPSRSTAILLLGAILSDTVILNSPTTTERDRAAVEYLERVLALEALEFGRDDVRRHVGPRRRVRRRDRHPRRQGVRGRRRADDRDRAGRDRRPGSRTSAARSCWRRCARRASGAATRCSR